MKKITSICLVFFMALALFAAPALAAAEFDGTVHADAAILIDANTGYVMFEKNATGQIRPASTTKILTCLVALEHSDMDEDVTVSRAAAGVTGSSLDLVSGEVVKMQDLLSGMMMVSGNDAATAVAEHIAGSTDAYVAMMNELAEEIGMTSSQFANVHGKDADGHYTTAADMALLARYAYQNDTFMQIVNREYYVMPTDNKRGEHTENNTNHLMDTGSSDYYRYATGMKTGLTPKAGGCLVASAKKGDEELICLVFGDNSSGESERWSLAPELFEFGFEHYTTVDLADLLEGTEPVQAQVENYAANDQADGLLEFAPPALQDQKITIEKEIAENILNGTDSVETVETYTVPEPLQAPILEGETVGTVTYRSANTGTMLYTGSLVATRDVLESGIGTGASGGTAVATLPPAVPEEIVTRAENPYVWFWLIIPAALVGFLVFRLISVNKSRSRRFSKKRRPRYKYRIRK